MQAEVDALGIISIFDPPRPPILACVGGLNFEVTGAEALCPQENPARAETDNGREVHED